MNSIDKINTVAGLKDTIPSGLHLSDQGWAAEGNGRAVLPRDNPRLNTYAPSAR